MKHLKPEDSPDLELFFSLSHDYLCIGGYDGYFRKVNPAFIELIGYTEAELFANPISHLVHPDDRASTAETRGHVLEGIPLLNFQNRYIKKSGEIVWLTWTSIPVPDKNIIYGIAKNITHLKKMEEDRQVLIKDLSSVNSALKQLTSAIAHDLRSPVNNMISLFSLLDLSKIQDEETLISLDLLEQSVRKLKDTLNDQVDHLKETLLPKSNLKLVNLREVFHTTVDSIRSLIEDSRTTFVVDFSEIENLMAHNFHLHSIFLNLITNSIKFAKPGTPPVITITTKKETDFSQVRFSDNGIGLDMKTNKDKLFGLNQVFTNHNDSKGVGLYLVKNHMTNLGGNIEVASEVNVGSTFTLTFRN